MRTRLAALIVLGFAAAGCAYPLAGGDPAGSTPPPRTTPSRSPVTVQPAAGTAKLISAELRQIRAIAARPDVPGYKRDQFGPTWTDDHTGRGGHNGCDTRIICTLQATTEVFPLVAHRFRARLEC
ncbi:hypothetical protein EV643_1588 [Kribbella sp. VKM Ac-2527]|uniref:Lipoprotein n=1 Tax=Kribbella caucasensis TaxID=2512215 RepID=A0A4R6IXK5_9ACTN|nr:hypothetical protein [Kribbella sp. VKM Ac-2527]TDO27504.1 hypothetical protein EV643_1588 [Kribbella sp. VKM Ac-2527]